MYPPTARRQPEPADRPRAAQVMVDVLAESELQDLRLEALLALGDFADILRVQTALGTLALCQSSRSICALRPSPRWSAGPMLRTIQLFRQLAADEILGPSGPGVLRLWRPDVVLLALNVPRLDGIAATKEIRDDLPGTEVVLLTGVGDGEETVVAAVRAGAMGYVRRDAAVGQGARGHWRRGAGSDVLSPRAAARLVHEVRCAEAQLPLSQRERDLLGMLGLSSTNKEIGQMLLIAESTVTTHVSAILGKLGAQSRTPAALHAVRLGLVSPGAARRCLTGSFQTTLAIGRDSISVLPRSAKRASGRYGSPSSRAAVTARR